MTMTSGYLAGFDPGMFGGLSPDLQWLPMALTASMIVIMIHALILAIGRMFNAGELEKYAKTELLNAFATILIVVFLTAMLTEAERVSVDTFFCNGKICPSLDCGGAQVTVQNLTSALDILQCRMADKASAFANMQEQVTVAAAVPLNMLNIYIGIIGIPVLQGNYVSSWYKEAETYRLINNLLTVLLIGTNAIVIVVDYVKNNMLGFFLPIGLLLRSFQFTRGVGAFFMAVALGFFFIFPVVYIVTDPGFVKPAFTAPAQPSSIDNTLCVPTFSGLTYYVQASIQGTTSTGSTQLSLDELRSDVSLVYSSLLLQPFIAFSITLMFIRYLMYILGGEPQDIMRAVAKAV